MNEKEPLLTNLSFNFRENFIYVRTCGPGFQLFTNLAKLLHTRLTVTKSLGHTREPLNTTSQWIKLLHLSTNPRIANSLLNTIATKLVFISMYQILGGYHVRVLGWHTGAEHNLTVENVHVEWLTAVKIPAKDVTVIRIVLLGTKTVDISQIRIHCQWWSWDLEILVNLITTMKSVTTQLESYDAGINERIFYFAYNCI